MKRVLLAGIAALALSGTQPARAVIPVTEDGPLLGITTQGWIKEAADAVKQLQELQRQYAMLTQQYEAIAHLPQNAMNMGRGLIASPSLQNPFPQSGQLSGIMSGSALGPVAALAGQFRQSNTYYEPQGDDPAAVEMRRRADGVSGVQAMATNAMHSLEERSASLKEFIGGISASPDIAETQAITARLQLEQNYASVQQAQVQQLMVLAKAQEQATQLRAEERRRQDAEELVRATSGVPLPGAAE
jgi:hypothetical protein